MTRPAVIHWVGFTQVPTENVTGQNRWHHSEKLWFGPAPRFATYYWQHHTLTNFYTVHWQMYHLIIICSKLYTMYYLYMRLYTDICSHPLVSHRCRCVDTDWSSRGLPPCHTGILSPFLKQITPRTVVSKPRWCLDWQVYERRFIVHCGA